MSKPRVLVTFSRSPEVREALLAPLEGLAEVASAPEGDADARLRALASADVVIAWSINHELHGEAEFRALGSARFLQLLSAGADQVPFEQIPQEVAVASNAGAFAEPMAEHVLAMALALAKHLPQTHAALARGEFDQRRPSREIRGAVVGILGFGGIGQASARLFRGLGARIHAVDRSGVTGEPVERIATLDGLDAVLAAADIVVIALPLNHATRGLLGARELSLMKPDAILVNVARGAIVDEDALYEHLRANPDFSAGIDVWWQEPPPHGAFATRRPFFELPNLLGSPHSSAITDASIVAAARQAGVNVARQLRGEPVLNLVERSDYVG